MNIENTLKRIESKIDILLKVQTPVWINEAEAMKRMGRSKDWFKKERLGHGKYPPTLIEGEDWRKINGRTPEYKATAIEKRKYIKNLRKKNNV